MNNLQLLPEAEDAELTWNFDDFLVGDQIVLVKHCVVLGQVTVTALFLLPTENGAVHCKERRQSVL